MAPEPCPGRAQGFTLLEVLIALIIFALAFGVLAQTMQTGLRQSQAAGDTTTAVLLARSLLSEVGVDVPLAPGIYEGAMEPNFRWQAEVRPAEIARSEQGSMLYRVRISVAWGEIGREQEVAISSLRIGPAPP